MQKPLALALALALTACGKSVTKDEVVYIVTSSDKQAEIRIPEEAIPSDVDILDISLEKTGDTYTVLPPDVVFLEDIEFRSNSVQIVRVIDGDTIIVKLHDGAEEYVRIVGIDAPEKGDCFSQEAMQRLAQLLTERSVTLQINSEGEDRDTYGRLLRYVLVNGDDVGAILLQEGYADNFPWFPHTKTQQYRVLTNEAETTKKGLWSSCTKKH